MAKLLELKEISASYGQIQALRDIDLEVNQGEVVALIGSNGAGKSTLLKTISGVIRPTKGEIRFRGSEIQQVQTHHIVKIGLIHVPEGRAILKRMTIEDNLLTGALYRNKREIHELLDEMYNLFPLLKERKKHLAGTLSGGQQQMLAIARGLMARPSLLMLDEPSLGLAPIMMKEVFELIGRLRERGMTILLVEQIARQALRMADRGYVLETGNITMSGKAQSMLHDEAILKAYLGG
jgi:branched-chain amino acid transport system ATP-binding protein